MNEVYRVIEEYFSNGSNNVRFEGNQKKSLESLIPFIQNLISYDRPDAYSIIDQTALIVEHFEFDSTFSNKKGSKNRQELARVERNFETKLSKISFQSKKTFKAHDELNVTHLTENYIKNAITVFKNHYKKIDKYKTNLFRKEKNNVIKNIKTMFWIEDSTLLGNVFISNNEHDVNLKPLVLLYCDKFLDELSNCKNLDYILCFSHYGNKQFIYFLDLNFISAYREKQINTSEIEIIDFSPHTTGFVMVLNDNEVKNETRN